MNPNKFGWADDIDAPRQEINTLSLLYEEASIQQILDQRKSNPATFLQDYRDARSAVREGSKRLEPSPEETVRLTQKVALFGTQASARARHHSRSRGMLSCICPDRPGVLAELSKLIASEGGNIEGAVMSVVGGHLVTVILVSGLAESLKREPESLTVGYTSMEAEDIDWPRPGSTCWHARASIHGDAALLLELTGQIRRLKLPLVTLSSWSGRDPMSQGDTVDIVDLNFAVAPDPLGNELDTIRDLETSVEKHLPGAQLDIVQVMWPTRYRPQENVGRKRKRDQVLTVVGHAEPGFVNSVLRTLAEEIDGVVDIRGSSMAILEGMTVLTVVFTRSKQASAHDIDKQIRRKLAYNPPSSEESKPVRRILIVGAGCPPRASKGRQWRRPSTHGQLGGPTHELRLQVAEQPGVVMKVAELLARSEVNITWFVSQVQEPSIGETWPICDIQMHLHMPEGKYDMVNGELRTLAEREGWDDVSLGEWSVDR